jgi:hypothetical protein
MNEEAMDIDIHMSSSSDNHNDKNELRNGDDGESTSTDGSNVVNDTRHESGAIDNETDTDESSKEELIPKAMTPIIQQPKRRFHLVISKNNASHTKAPTVRASTDTSDASMTVKLRNDEQHVASPTKISTARTATTVPTGTGSPIRIKLSLKKIPKSNNSNNNNITSNATTETIPHRNSTSATNGTPSDNRSIKDAAIATSDQITSKNAVKLKATPNHNITLNIDSPIPGGALEETNQSLPAIQKAATGTASKRRSVLPSKQVRIPPLTSPGLCMLRPPVPLPLPEKRHSTSKTSSAYYTPQQVFDTVMTGAGYTYEQRTEHPHRGSSVQRTIGDMFDTNVQLALHPIELVPSDIWNHIPTPETTTAALSNSTSDFNGMTLPNVFIRAFDESKKIEMQKRQRPIDSDDYADDTTVEMKKRSQRSSYKTVPFRDMVPVSLILPYPEWYIQKRVEYIKQVKLREVAIVKWQEAQEELDMAVEDSDDRDVVSKVLINPITIPPIPQAPDPLQLHEFEIVTPNSEENENGCRSNLLAPYNDPIEQNSGTESRDSSTHPIYLPKSNNHFVEHLDPNCFHSTDGRYFGLRTNMIADPNFIGPNTPGLTGVTSTGGLATATTSTTTSTSGLTGGGMTMILSASFHCAAATVPTNLKDDTSNVVLLPNKVQPLNTEEEAMKLKSPNDKSCATPASALPASSPVDASPFKTETEIPTLEADNKAARKRAFSELRQIMEGSDAELIETFRVFIVRAIVHTFRTHAPLNTAFRGPNNECYPDIGKAFASYGGIKPCDRCKSNKQGVCNKQVYYCCCFKYCRLII